LSHAQPRHARRRALAVARGLRDHRYAVEGPRRAARRDDRDPARAVHGRVLRVPRALLRHPRAQALPGARLAADPARRPRRRRAAPRRAPVRRLDARRRPRRPRCAAREARGLPQARGRAEGLPDPRDLDGRVYGRRNPTARGQGRDRCDRRLPQQLRGRPLHAPAEARRAARLCGPGDLEAALTRPLPTRRGRHNRAAYLQAYRGSVDLGAANVFPTQYTSGFGVYANPSASAGASASTNADPSTRQFADPADVRAVLTVSFLVTPSTPTFTFFARFGTSASVNHLSPTYGEVKTSELNFGNSAYSL